LDENPFSRTEVGYASKQKLLREKLKIGKAMEELYQLRTFIEQGRYADALNLVQEME